MGLSAKKEEKMRVVDAPGECEEMVLREGQDGVCGRQQAQVVMNVGVEEGGMDKGRRTE